MTGKLKLKGNIIQALMPAAIADRLNKVLAGIRANGGGAERETA